MGFAAFSTHTEPPFVFLARRHPQSTTVLLYTVISVRGITSLLPAFESLKALVQAL